MTGLVVDASPSVLRLTLDRPESLNSLTTPMLVEATRAIDECTSRVIVITGAGRAFCSGGDLGALTPHNIAEGMDAGNALVRAILSTPRLVIAVVNGLAVGAGCSIALACDFVIARTSAYFTQSFIQVGLMPDGAATALLAASVGRARATEMMLLGEAMLAADAAACGLIHRMVDDEDFEDAAEALVDKTSRGAPLAQARTKAAINAASLGSIDAILDREREGQIALLRSQDWKEGADAFFRKQPPRFTGR